MIGSPEARKRVGRVGSALWFCLLTLALAWSPAMAVDLKEWVPGLKLTPFLSERVEYESNVFQVPSHSQGDEIFWTMPGVAVEYTAGSHSLSALYRAEFLNYVNLTDLNTTHHVFGGSLNLVYPRTTVTVTDSFARTTDTPSTEITGPVQSTTNVVSSTVQYRLSPGFAVGPTFSWLHQSFDQSAIANLINRDEYVVGGSMYWKVQSKTDLSLNYYHGWTTFADASDRNYSSDGFTVGLSGQITPKLSSTYHVGYTHQSADNSNQVAYSGLVMGGGWTYTPTAQTTISLNSFRSAQASTDGRNPYYVTTSVFLSAGVQLLPKVTVNARVGGGVNNYPTKDTIFGKTDWREDTFGVAGAGIVYSIQRWLQVGLDYARTNRNSNFSSFNFVDEHVSGRVSIEF